MSNEIQDHREPPQDNLVYVACGEMLLIDADRMKAIYHWLVQHHTEIGAPITHLAMPGYGRGNYVNYQRTHKRVESDDWSKFEYLTLMHFKPERKGLTMAFECTTHANLALHQTHQVRQYLDLDDFLLNRWHIHWAIDPLDAGCDPQAALDALIDFARQMFGDYGYLYTMPRHEQPFFYASGMSAGRLNYPEQLSLQRQGWGSDIVHYCWKLLRDVYPYNFLARPYLDLDVFGQSLEAWIQADSSRGSLELLTDEITLWRPSAENIPAIREQLFRSGIVYYYKNFPWARHPRDIHGPKVYRPDQPIPAMFRPDD